jgi:hypothetical protein
MRITLMLLVEQTRPRLAGSGAGEIEAGAVKQVIAHVRAMELFSYPAGYDCLSPLRRATPRLASHTGP